MTTKTRTPHYVVLAVDADQHLTIASAHHGWTDAINAWERLDDERRATGAAGWFMVREADHELVAQAAAAEVASLSERQREVLAAFGRIGRPVTPGSRKAGSPDPITWQRESHLYASDIIAPARKLAARGLVTIGGLSYAPKTYTLTWHGRLVAAAANA